MNLLIVDDEPIIRVGLRTLVDWEANGFRLVGEAADGREAVQVMRDIPVDILITDILMPGMDGLELIRRTRSEWGDIGILVLSCLDDFTYVKEAMKLGASDYVLKPTMEPDELISVLKEMKSALVKQRADREQISEWQKWIERSRPYQISSRLLRAVEQQSDDPELEREIWKDGAIYSIMVYWTGAHMLPLEEWKLEDCRASLQWTDQMRLLFFGCDKHPSALYRYQQSFGQANAIRSGLYAGLDEDGDKARCMIGIGPIIHRLADLPTAIEYHVRQFRHAFYSEWDGAILRETEEADEQEGVLPYELRNDLFRSIGYNNGEALFHHVEAIARWIAREKPDVSKLHSFIFELMGLAVGYAREQGYTGLDEFEQRYVSLEFIQSCFPVGRLSQWLRDALQELWSLRFGGAERTAAANPFIRKAIQFMNDNYHRNIGTVDIAEHVRLSRSYLSDLYSKEMGESLAESLARIRIEEAKKRLLQDNFKVYEIAEAVGFSDAKTFARAFRKLVGCSPKEYEMRAKPN